MDNSPDNQPKTSYHPRLNDNGKPVLIQKLSEPTGMETWSDPMAIATFIPDGAVPDELNSIPFEPWAGLDDDLDWEELSDESDFDEPALNLDKPTKVSSGAIIREPDGRFWIVHPTNGFGGYKATFPKGTAEGLSLQANAIKECWEESGLKVRLTAFFGDFKRTTGVSRYYLAERVGGTPTDAGWESQAVSLVPLEGLHQVFNMPPDKHLAKLLVAMF